MLYIYSSNIQTGHFADFQKWVAAEQRGFAEAQPKGWTLQGIYMTAFGLGQQHVEIHWEIENYASLDVARAAAEPGQPYNTFLNALHAYLDPGTSSARLLKSLGGTSREAFAAVDRDSALVVGC